MKQNIINLFRCTIALAALLIASTASAVVSESYKITKADTQNGSYSVTVNGEEAETAVAGATVTIIATPDTGYEVDGTPVVSVTTDWGRANARAMTRGEIPTEGTVAVTAGTTAGTWTFTMPNDDVTIKMFFSQIDYALSFADGIQNGEVTVAEGKTTANYGDEITLSNTPAEGYELDAYSVKDAASNAVTVTNGKFTMPASAVTISATFKKINYALSFADGIENGVVTVAEGKTTAQMGDEVILNNTPAEGYELDAYSVKNAAGNAVTVTNGKFTMPASAVTISATFKKTIYTLTIAEGILNGTVTASAQTATIGDEITLTITPATGYELDALSVKNGETAIEVTDGKFTMPAGAVTVSATFSKIDYTISIPESFDNGSITVSKTTAHYGDIITLTITPAKNYMLGTLVVKDAAGNPIEVTNGKFVMPAGTVTISATFVIAGFEINVGPGEYATFYKEVALYVEDEDAELYTITSVTDTEAVLSDKLNVVAANTPMLVYNKGTEEKTFLLIPTEEKADQVNVADEFKGTLEAQEMPASTEGNDYYVCTGKEFVWVMNEGRIGANRCWLEIIAQAAGARANTRSITGGGETTGMKNLTPALSEGEGVWYDLQGRKVEKPNRKGIYIHNGKKVIKH